MYIPIIGCGVMGLTCGIRLLEAGHQAHIIAKDLPPNTTSNWAAAIWFPYKAFPVDKVLRWSKVSYDECYRLIEDPAAGIRDTQLIQLFSEPMPDPWWQEAVNQFGRLSPDQLPLDYADAFVVTVPVIDTRMHMQYLVNRFQQLGGMIEQRELHHVDEIETADNIILNCAGLGSRTLFNDETVYPIRGQIIRVKADDARISYLDDTGSRAVTYVIPRIDDVILGGTAMYHDWNETPNPDTAAEILRKAKELAPELGENPEILQHGVGLRPGRDVVRLEKEEREDGRIVIHNYGHGGAGFTLAWGCAADVVTWVQAV